MIILDTDHATHFGYPDSDRGRRLMDRMDESPDQDFAITIITVEEQLRGWLARIARERVVARQVPLYWQLGELVRVFGGLTVVPFTQTSSDQYAQIRHTRIGTMDKKIASIALANSALLLTANSRDFAQIPGLQFADWTA